MTMSPVRKTWAGLVLGLSIAGFSLSTAATPAQAAEAALGTYVTQQDDTFWKVAKKLHLPLQELLDANPGIAVNNVYPGLTMKLPGTAAGSERTLAAATATALSAPTPSSATAAPAPAGQPTVTAASGEKLAYSRTLSAVASAYTDSPAENGGWGAVDYFGNALKLGTIAVDSKVIPLGTKVYITGYNFDGLPTGLVATATDMGGAIKGNRIDVFIPSSIGNAADFGLQNVSIYVLK